MLFFFSHTAIFAGQNTYSDFDSLINQAEDLRAKGQWDDAINKYKEALQLNPDSDQALFGLGLIAETENDFNTAGDYFRSLIQKNPSHSDAFFHLGAIAYTQQRNREACQYFERAVSLEPKMMAAHYNLGLSYAELGNYEKARESFRNVAKLNPANEWAFYQIARTYEAQGFPHEARAGYQEALKLNPNFSEARENLLQLSETNSENDQSVDDLRQKANRQIALTGGSFGGGFKPATPFDSFRDLAYPAQNTSNKAMLMQLGAQMIQEFLSSRRQN